MLVDHLEKLWSFQAAAREKSFLKAGRATGLSQPAVTKNIRILEEELGTTLFTRHRRGAELTAAGRILYAYGEELFLRTRDVEKRIGSSRELAGVVRVGTYETLGESFWPAALKTLAASHPDLVIELTTENSSSLRDRLRTGGIDLIVDAEPPVSEEFFSKVLYTDRFGLFCAPNSAFETRTEDVPLCLVPHATERHGQTPRQLLDRLPYGFRYLYEVESFTIARSFAASDVCVSVLPLRLAEPDARKKSLKRYRPDGKSVDFGEHRICATVRAEAREEPRLEALLRFLKAATRPEGERGK